MNFQKNKNVEMKRKKSKGHSRTFTLKEQEHFGFFIYL